MSSVSRKAILVCLSGNVYVLLRIIVTWQTYFHFIIGLIPILIYFRFFKGHLHIAVTADLIWEFTATLQIAKFYFGSRPAFYN